MDLYGTVERVSLLSALVVVGGKNGVKRVDGANYQTYRRERSGLKNDLPMLKKNRVRRKLAQESSDQWTKSVAEATAFSGGNNRGDGWRNDDSCDRESEMWG